MSVLVIYCCTTNYPHRSLKQHLLSHLFSEGQEPESNLAEMGVWGPARAEENCVDTQHTQALQRSPVVEPHDGAMAQLTCKPASPPTELSASTQRVLSSQPPRPLIKHTGKLAQSHTTNLQQQD